jgi:hypothetical protein
MLVICAGAWSAGALRAERQGGATPATTGAPAPASTPADARKPATKPVAHERRDLYGNPIEKAVGEYRIDFDGALYEQHAPQIGVPRLPAPTL